MAFFNRTSMVHALDEAIAQRHALGFSGGYATCALVGSSGSLLYDRFGAEIDSADLIIRFNNAPTIGFERVVGSRTDVRLLNSHAASAVLQRCASFTPGGECAPRATTASGTEHQTPSAPAADSICCPSGRVLLNSGRDRIVNCYRQVCGNASVNALSILATHPLPAAFKRALPAGKSIVSGVYAIAIAQLVCTSSISLYGFTSVASAAAVASTHRVSSYPYHYYDRCGSFASDELNATAHGMAAGWFRRSPRIVPGSPPIRIREPIGAHERLVRACRHRPAALAHAALGHASHTQCF